MSTRQEVTIVSRRKTKPSPGPYLMDVELRPTEFPIPTSSLSVFRRSAASRPTCHFTPR